MTTLHRFALLGLIAFGSSLFAEPWLASRVAQNCAACHSPGRVSESSASGKRCSLSCKSCHTNPNGGGLRNAYGKWLEERWLRSNYFADYKMNKPHPAPLSQQHYQEQVLKNYLAGIKDPKDITRVANEGFRLVETADSVSESEYNRAHTPTAIVDDAQDAKLHIPQGDPYRVTQSSYFNAGVDFRWFYLNSKINDVEKKGIVPMSTDLAVSFTPAKHTSLVWESRFLSDPRTASVWDDAYTSESTVRSAYLLIDDMPYNSYAMYGIFQPMFGNQDADHTSLSSRAAGLDERATFKAGSIGTAGNFPFFNVSLIEPFENRDMRQDRGLVLNLGLRFQSGVYAMLSWWDTKAKDYTTNVITSHRMTAFTGGFTAGRSTVVLQVNDILLDVPNVRRDSGTVISLEPRYRVWRESYVKVRGEYLNTSPTFRNGSASQIAAGLGTYLASGLELEAMYEDLRSSELGVSSRETNWWAQAHLFF